MTNVTEMNWKAICALYKTTFPEGTAKSKADKIAALQAFADQHAPRKTRVKPLEAREVRLIKRYCRPTTVKTCLKLEVAIAAAKARNAEKIVVTPADLANAGLGQAWAKQPSSFLSRPEYYHYRTLSRIGYVGQNVKGGLLVTPVERDEKAEAEAMAVLTAGLLASEAEAA